MRIAFLTEGGEPVSGHRGPEADPFMLITDDLSALGHVMTVIRFPSSSEKGGFSRFVRRLGIFRQVLFGRYDVLHVRSVNLLPYASVVRAFRPGIGIVVDAEAGLSGRFADRIISSDGTEPRNVRDRHDGKAVAVPEPTDTERAETTEYLDGFGLKKGRYVLFAPRAATRGETHYVVKAFRGIGETGRLPNGFKLAVVGDRIDIPEYERNPEGFISDPGSVLFLGEQAGEARRELFSHAAVFVHPASEGADTALPEAMGFGLPVTAADTPWNREVLGNAGASFFRDTASLGSVLARLLARSDERVSYGRLAKERFGIRYSAESVARKIADVYAEAVDRRLGSGYVMQRKNHHV